MENTVLHQFINYHDQLIAEMRKQIASMHQISSRFHQLKQHREKMINQMKQILGENKQRIKTKQSDLEKVCEQVKAQSELFQQLETNYKQMKEEYRMLSKNQPVWETISHELSNDKKSSQKIIQNSKKKCDQNALKIAGIAAQCATNKQEIKALMVEAMLKQQEQEYMSIQYRQISKYRVQIAKSIAIIDEFIEKEHVSQQKIMNMKGMIEQKTEDLHQEMKAKEQVRQNYEQKCCSNQKLKANLENQRIHICNMLKSEETISCNLTNTLDKAEKILQFKSSQLNTTQKQLEKYLQKINKNNMHILQKQNFKIHLLNHIKSLHQVNQMLQTQIGESEMRDVKLTQILKFKIHTNSQYNKEDRSNQGLADIIKKNRGAFYETADDSQFSSASNFMISE